MVLCTWRPSELHCSVHTGPTSDFQSNRTTQNKAAIFPTALSYLQKCEKLQTATGTSYLKNLWLYWSETTSLLYCCMKERLVPTLWLHCLHERLVENKPHDGLKRSQSSSHSHFLRLLISIWGESYRSQCRPCPYSINSSVSVLKQRTESVSTDWRETLPVGVSQFQINANAVKAIDLLGFIPSLPAAWMQPKKTGNVT